MSFTNSFTDSPNASERAKFYKNNSKSDTSDSRRRRTECSIELRRQKRNDEMMKRRNLSIDIEEVLPSDTSITSDPQDSVGEKLILDSGTKAQHEAISVEDAIAILTANPTKEDLRRAFEGIRRTLSKPKDPPVQHVIKSGLVQALVQGLCVDDEKVQFECAWALTNIVSGTSEETMAVIQAGAVRPLINLCNSNSSKLAEQAIWAVANIAGESTALRDHVIEEGLVQALTKLMAHFNSLPVSFVQTLAWTYSNLVRHKNPQVPYETLKKIAPGIAALLKHADLPVQQDICWALSYLTDGTDQNIELAYHNNVIPDVVRYLSSSKDAMISPALRVLGNFATGSDELTQVVVDCGVLKSVIPSLLKRSNVSIVKECCWLVSNVIAGTQSQIGEVISAGILPLLFNVLRMGEHRAQYEASWAIANLGHGGSANQILEILEIEGSIDAICHCLSVKNNELVVNMLEVIHAILKTVCNNDPDKLEGTQLRLEECGVLEKLEELQRHESQNIYELAFKIVEDFFNDDSDADDLAPYDQPLDLTANTPFNF